MNINTVLDQAVLMAAVGPCHKSKRGVVIFRPESFEIISFGHKSPPHPFVCDGSDSCKSACNKVAIHAEEAALLNALSRGRSICDMDMLHVKVENGRAVPSGGPSCWQCSRSILYARIAGMWLLHESGLKRYTAKEFHKFTLIECGLHVGDQ